MCCDERFEDKMHSLLFSILCGLCVVIGIEGQTVILQGSTSYAVLGDDFHFICNVSGGNDTTAVISFLKDSYTACAVNQSGCVGTRNHTSYSCGCLSGNTRIYMNISDANKNDAGNWTCRYKDINSNNSHLDVYYPPTITSVPSNKNVTENTSPNIDCSSNITPGNPSSTNYSWTGPGGYSKTGAVLDRTVNRTQGGQYICTANNTAGLSDTAMVIINVQYAPSITSVTGNKNVGENTSPDIDCSRNITPGNPSSTNYNWIGPGGYSKTGAVLDKTVTRTQAGQYNCTATNTAGLSDTAQVNVNVMYIDVPFMEITPSLVKENGSVKVLCNVTSKPIVKMIIKNKENNTNLVFQEETNSRQYDIERVQCLHNGTYQCVAFNRILNRTHFVNASLNVLCSPRHDFRKKITYTVVSDVNTTATMIAEVIANPLPNFTWGRYDNGQLEPITENTLHTSSSNDLKAILKITISQSRDYGNYAVKIQNELGTSLMKYELTSQSPPFRPTEFSYKLTGDKSLSLTWMSMYNGGEEQMFYVEYQRMDSDIKHQLQHGIPDPGRHRTVTQDIYEITTNKTYNFTLYSRNVYGDSEVVTMDVITSIPQGMDDNKYNPIVGVSAGLGVVVLILIALTVGGAIFIYRLMTSRKKLQDLETDPNTYSNLHPSLERRDEYDMINALQSTGASNEYENVKIEKTKDDPIYANQAKDSSNDKSSVYVNHLSIMKSKLKSDDTAF